MSKLVTLEVPDDAVRLSGRKAEAFVHELFEARVVRWFDEGRISQGKAAELLGISRSQLFDVLSQYKVSPIQVSPDEYDQEFGRD
jgi:predicted HTH domain antitoxin